MKIPVLSELRRIAGANAGAVAGTATALADVVVDEIAHITRLALPTASHKDHTCQCKAHLPGAGLNFSPKPCVVAVWSGFCGCETAVGVGFAMPTPPVAPDEVRPTRQKQSHKCIFNLQVSNIARDYGDG